MMMKLEKSDHTTLSDLELASRIAARDVAAVRLVTARNNQRPYRLEHPQRPFRSGGGRSRRLYEGVQRYQDLCRDIVAVDLANPNRRQ
jgi:hypothetical protein